MNRPVNFNDPSGHCAELVTALLCAAAVGALVGATVSYASQVANNVSLNGWSSEAFTDVDGGKIATAAVSGAVSGVVGLTVGLGVAAITGTGFLATVAGGAIAGAASGQASRAVVNTREGKSWNDGLFNSQDMITDALIGGATAGFGHILGRIKFSSKYVTGDFEPNSTTQYNITKSSGGSGAAYAEYDTATTRALYRADLEGPAHHGIPTPHQHNALWNPVPGKGLTFNGWGTRAWQNVFPANPIKAYIIGQMVK
jgi:hypothetical protein